MNRGVAVPTMRAVRNPTVPSSDEPTMSDPTITAFITKLLCDHGGCLAVSEIQHHLSLPPAHIVGLLREEPSRFLLLEQAGVVLVLSSVRLCKNYLREKCQAQDCVRLHLCRVFILGQCFHRSKGNTCEFSHNIQSEVNMAVLKANNISNLDERELQVLLLLNDPSFLPEVCMDYTGKRLAESCQNGVQCNNLHICRLFTKGECWHTRCYRSHNLLDPNVLHLLEAQGLSKEMCQNIQLMLDHQYKTALKEPRDKDTKGHSRSTRACSASRLGRHRSESRERMNAPPLHHFPITTAASHKVFPGTAAPNQTIFSRNRSIVDTQVRVRSSSTPPTAATTSMVRTSRTPIPSYRQSNNSVAGSFQRQALAYPAAAYVNPHLAASYFLNNPQRHRLAYAADPRQRQTLAYPPTAAFYYYPHKH